MPALPFGWDLFGYRNGVPNIADKDGRSSVEIAGRLFEILGVSGETKLTGPSAGSLLEVCVRTYLSDELPRREPNRQWRVRRGVLINGYTQYEHLARLQPLIDQDTTGTLSVEIGRDYEVRADVVGIHLLMQTPILHTAVPCKFTIHSDRVQNTRHEAVILTQHHRGRQQHITAVTCEPQPSRLAAIARCAGEVDAVYHVALDEFLAATAPVGNVEQEVILGEIVGQGRLFDLASLPSVLVV